MFGSRVEMKKRVIIICHITDMKNRDSIVDVIPSETDELTSSATILRPRGETHRRTDKRWNLMQSSRKEKPVIPKG